MPRTLGTNLHMCFTKLKHPPSPQSSLQEHHHQQEDDHIHTPYCSSSNTILIKNFNTLYDPTLTYTSSNSKSPTSSESDTDTTATPDFATVYASQRFFFSSPGRSNSIIESTSSSSSSSSFLPEKQPESDNVVGGGIPIPTISPDPFLDFRRSMQEMVEARDLMDVRANNWEYLHELLTCYLSLNPKSTHKFIVGAFADLLVSLMTSSPVESGRRRGKSSSACEISRNCIYD